MNKVILLIVAIQSAAIALAAEDIQLAVYAPRPRYSYEALARRLQGSGTAILTVDPATGNVTNVVMATSTGVRSLDDETISTFHRWRFKPGTVSKVSILISFTMSRE